MRFNGIEIADIFSKYGEEYRDQYHQPANLTKVMNLITCCRTAALGGHIEKCDNCGYETNAYNSCRNRHCPKCQFSAKERWLKAREGELLPVPYYHVVFTIPNELNQVVLINKRVMYNILFRAASETLMKLGKDPRHLGANIGLIAVLHTWGQNLMDHPHLHCIVPGGGLTLDGVRWKYSKKAKYRGFFIHVNVISELFKKKFLYYFKKAYRNSELKFVGKIEGLGSNKAFQKLLNELYEKKWVTYCKRPFGGSKQVLEYLGRYTHRVAISNNRIKTIANEKVVFEYKDYRDNKSKEMALTPVEFIRRFMLHILPEGFFKIRYYGILSSRNKKAALKRCREILVEVNAEKNSLQVLVESYRWICSKCKEGKVFVVGVNIRAAPA
ncbi:MAG: IS91 family transposase [Thermodesulfobacteriota bacterium]